MLSSLRVRSSTSATFARNFILGDARPLAACGPLHPASNVSLTPIGRARAFSTEATGKKPPKHSEKFYQIAKSQPDKATSEKTIHGGSGGELKGFTVPGFGTIDEELLCISAAVAIFLMYDFHLKSQGDAAGEEITMQELMQELVAKGHVERIQIVNKTSGRVLLRSDAPAEYANHAFRIEIGTPEAFEAKLEQFQAKVGIRHLEYVPVQYVKEMPTISPYLMILPLLHASLCIASGKWKGLNFGGSGRIGRNMMSMMKGFSARRKVFPMTLKVTANLLLTVMASLTNVK